MSEFDKQTSLDFTEIALDVKSKAKRLPRRRVYFSDGYLDEYSTDDEDEKDTGNMCSQSQTLINPKTLTWLPYIWYMTMMAGTKALAVCDYLGEHLAYFFGITTPKFQYEIEQCKKILEEEEALRKKLDEYNAGWGNKDVSNENPIEIKPVLTQATDKKENVEVPVVNATRTIP